MGKRGYYGVGLHNPKTPANVGAALRAAGVYSASFVRVQGRRFKPGRTDTMKTHRHMPYDTVDDLMDVIPHGCVPVAIELVEGAKSLFTYEHPERAIYIFGAEDATLGVKILDRCRDIVQIPTNGCMNLAACVNVVLYDRAMKEAMNNPIGDIRSFQRSLHETGAEHDENADETVKAIYLMIARQLGEILDRK